MIVDLSPIKQYISDETLNHSQQAIFQIDRIGFDEWFDSQINIFCNCTKTFKDGRRCTQTNDKRYNYELTTTVQMIEQCGGPLKHIYYERLLKQHEENLEFERINGLEYDPYSKPKTKQKGSTTRKNKQLSLDIDKPKKETASERKLKAHAIKLNALLFKPKPVNNDNTL